MKASRAYIASLGTTSVLIGFALLLLVVVSAILGFRGWPAGGGSGDAQSLTIRSERELTKLAPIRFEAAAPTAATSSRAAARARAPQRSKAKRLDSGAVRGASDSGASAPAQAGPASGSAPAPAAPAAGSGSPSPGAGVDDARSGLAGATEDATQGVSGALGGADSGLGQTVSETGQAVSGIVESGDSVQSQLPQLPSLP